MRSRLPAEQPEHGRGNAAPSAPEPPPLPPPASEQTAGPEPSPRGAAELPWPGSAPLPPAPGQGRGCRVPWRWAQLRCPTLCPLERPKCDAGTPEELLGAALALLQLSRAHPASRRALCHQLCSQPHPVLSICCIPGAALTLLLLLLLADFAGSGSQTHPGLGQQEFSSPAAPAWPCPAPRSCFVQE